MSRKTQEKRRINGFNIITLKPGCRANLDRHVFTSGIEVEETIVLKQNNLDLHLIYILEIELEEENEFLELIEHEQQRTRKPIDIADVQKKFHLKLLQKKASLFPHILGSASGITTVIVLLVVAVLLYRFCVKKRAKQGHTNTFCHFDTLQERVNLAADSNRIISTEFTDITRPASDSETRNESRIKTIDIHSVLNPVSPDSN